MRVEGIAAGERLRLGAIREIHHQQAADAMAFVLGQQWPGGDDVFVKGAEVGHVGLAMLLADVRLVGFVDADEGEDHDSFLHREDFFPLPDGDGFEQAGLPVRVAGGEILRRPAVGEIEDENGPVHALAVHSERRPGDANPLLEAAQVVQVSLSVGGANLGMVRLVDAIDDEKL